MAVFTDIVLGYGQSDKNLFTASYVMNWSTKWFDEKSILKNAFNLDAIAVLYRAAIRTIYRTIELELSELASDRCSRQ